MDRLKKITILGGGNIECATAYSFENAGFNEMEHCSFSSETIMGVLTLARKADELYSNEKIEK